MVFRKKRTRMGVAGTVTPAVFLLQMWSESIPSGRPEAQGNLVEYQKHPEPTISPLSWHTSLNSGRLCIFHFPIGLLTPISSLSLDPLPCQWAIRWPRTGQVSPHSCPLSMFASPPLWACATHSYTAACSAQPFSTANLPGDLISSGGENWQEEADWRNTVV